MKVCFTVPWGCFQPNDYDMSVMPIPRIGEFVRVWVDPEKRPNGRSKLPRQDTLVVQGVVYDLADMNVTVSLVAQT